MESDKITSKGYIVREAWGRDPQLALWRNAGQLPEKEQHHRHRGHRHPPPHPHHPGERRHEQCHPDTFDPADPASKEKTDALLASEIRAYAVTDAVRERHLRRGRVTFSSGRRDPHRADALRLQAQHRAVPGQARLQGHGDACLCHGRGSGRPEPGRHHAVNGPGDPAEPVEVIENLKHIFALNIPTFGICLGHQLGALAAGARP